MRTGPILIVAGVFVATQPVFARIVSTRPSPSETWSPVLALTIGGEFEYETDPEQTTYEFPLFLEYNVTPELRFSIEPNFVYIESKSEDVRSMGGLGDLETSVSWEFLRERRYRPALTAEGIIKWPTASDPEFGDPGYDYSLGLIASKDFVYFETDVGVQYTSVGDSEEHDVWELTVAAEIPVNYRLSILLESVTDFETGLRGRTDTEFTAGLSWRVNEFLTLEGGGTLESTGQWKLIFGWEWNFAGED